MNISKVLQSFGTLSLINFARKHAEKLAGSAAPEVRALADWSVGNGNEPSVTDPGDWTGQETTLIINKCSLLC